ncbi:MAG: hypothetical protein P4L53_23630 [Candidatus Obscuribacterales bacterium]|nr:hypothetical protein [Candidatus Obscuribacterales bacterium]
MKAIDVKVSCFYSTRWYESYRAEPSRFPTAEAVGYSKGIPIDFEPYPHIAIGEESGKDTHLERFPVYPDFDESIVRTEQSPKIHCSEASLLRIANSGKLMIVRPRDDADNRALLRVQYPVRHDDREEFHYSALSGVRQLAFGTTTIDATGHHSSTRFPRPDNRLDKVRLLVVEPGSRFEVCVNHNQFHGWKETARHIIVWTGKEIRLLDVEQDRREFADQLYTSCIEPEGVLI